ncbi:MAG: DUF3822 family protein [Crocinitomicaceae bacterium]|nr:DUF3822 family protein [Crocinitomicaceae bacterium]
MASHLAIQVTDNAARFVSIKNSVVVNQHDLVLKDDASSSKKEMMENGMRSISFLAEDFDEVTLSWATKKSSLVPNTIFADTKPSSVYELCFGKNSTENSIDYNRIAELSVVNVYDMPDWIKRIFVIKYPRIMVQHEGTHVLRQVMSASAFYLKATVVLYHDHFQLTLVKHNNLEFYSFFDYQSSEDVLYHLMFTLQQKEFTNEKGSLELVAGAECKNDVIENLSRDIKRVKDLEQLEVLTPKDFIPKSQQLCV